MAVADLRTRFYGAPQVDTSWLGGLLDNIGGAIDQAGDQKLVRQALGSQGQPQAPGMPSSIAPTSSRAASSPQAYTAPVTAVARGQAQGDTYQPFIDTVKTRVTNPYGLAAVAATGRAESGWSGNNANRTWSDPSQSGQAGTAGGVMSWRAERLGNLQKYAASKGEQGNGSPQTQAEFFLNEDPQLIDRLNQAKSPTEAADIIAGSWKFAGYDQQGGEAARRRALAQNYFSNEFSGMPMEQGDTSAVAGYVDPMVSTPNSRPSTSLPGEVAQAGPMPSQGGGQGSNVIAQGVTPIARGGFDPEVLSRLISNPRLRELGVAMWKQNAGQSQGEPWQFVNLQDGTIGRFNQQTGELTSLGNYAKPKEAEEPKIVELFDEATGQPYKAQFNPQTGGYDRVGGVKARSGMQLTTNPDGTVSLTEGPINSMPKLSESEGRNAGFYGRGVESHEILNKLEDQGTSIWNKTAGNLPVVGNFLRSEDAQKFDQAKRNFINAVLRRESGAVIAPEEFANADQQYFPQPGDGEEVIEQKRRNRETTIQGLKVSSGQGANFAIPPQQGAAGQKQRTSSGIEWSIEP